MSASFTFDFLREFISGWWRLCYKVQPLPVCFMLQICVISHAIWTSQKPTPLPGMRLLPLSGNLLFKSQLKCPCSSGTFSDSPRAFIVPSHPHGCWYRSHWLHLWCSSRVTFRGCFHPWTLRFARAGMIGRQLSSRASPEYLVCAWPVLCCIELPWQ